MPARAGIPANQAAVRRYRDPERTASLLHPGSAGQHRPDRARTGGHRTRRGRRRARQCACTACRPDQRCRARPAARAGAGGAATHPGQPRRAVAAAGQPARARALAGGDASGRQLHAHGASGDPFAARVLQWSRWLRGRRARIRHHAGFRPQHTRAVVQRDRQSADRQPRDGKRSDVHVVVEQSREPDLAVVQRRGQRPVRRSILHPRSGFEGDLEPDAAADPTRRREL